MADQQQKNAHHTAAKREVKEQNNLREPNNQFDRPRTNTTHIQAQQATSWLRVRQHDKVVPREETPAKKSAVDDARPHTGNTAAWPLLPPPRHRSYAALSTSTAPPVRCAIRRPPSKQRVQEGTKQPCSSWQLSHPRGFKHQAQASSSTTPKTVTKTVNNRMQKKRVKLCSGYIIVAQEENFRMHDGHEKQNKTFTISIPGWR